MKATKFFRASAILLIAQAALLPKTALAGSGQSISVPVEDIDIYDTLTTLSNYLLGIVVIVSIFMMIWAGFNFVTAGDDEAKVKKAKSIIMYAVVGLIVAIMAKSIVSLVKSIPST